MIGFMIIFIKRDPLSAGQIMREKYERGLFHTKEDFLEELKNLAQENPYHR